MSSTLPELTGSYTCTSIKVLTKSTNTVHVDYSHDILHRTVADEDSVWKTGESLASVLNSIFNYIILLLEKIHDFCCNFILS